MDIIYHLISIEQLSDLAYIDEHPPNKKISTTNKKKIKRFEKPPRVPNFCTCNFSLNINILDKNRRSSKSGRDSSFRTPEQLNYSNFVLISLGSI